jgi:hypothetical protein
MHKVNLFSCPRPMVIWGSGAGSTTPFIWKEAPVAFQLPLFCGSPVGNVYSGGPQLGLFSERVFQIK